MDWRNARYNQHGTIDLEIEHPVYGWIPFTANPEDTEQLGRDLHAEALASGKVAPYVAPAQSMEALQASIVQAVQTRLDAFAKERGYDGILSAATYAGSANPQFAAEGQRALELRDATWTALYGMLAEVQAGLRPVPAGFDAIESELPALGW